MIRKSVILWLARYFLITTQCHEDGNSKQSLLQYLLVFLSVNSTYFVDADAVSSNYDGLWFQKLGQPPVLSQLQFCGHDSLWEASTIAEDWKKEFGVYPKSHNIGSAINYCSIKWIKRGRAITSWG